MSDEDDAVLKALGSFATEIRKDHKLEERQSLLEVTLNKHETDCERRYGEVKTKFAEHGGMIEATRTRVESNTKMVWAVLFAVIMFGINSMFNFVGG